jgi:hypothetical protein
MIWYLFLRFAGINDSNQETARLSAAIPQAGGLLLFCMYGAMWEH